MAGQRHHVTVRVGVRLLRACFMFVAASRAGVAQTLTPTPPAVCGASVRTPTPVLPDSDAITGVVVRFTATATRHSTDAHLAKALSTVTAEALQSVVDAPVRTRFEVSARRGREDASAAVADGRVLGVRWVVSGRAERFGDSVRVTWNLLDSRSGLTRGTGLTREALVKLGTLSANMARDVGRAIGVDSIPPAISTASPTVKSVAAFEQYLAGLYDADSFNPPVLQRAVSALHRAVQAEPTLQAAWTSLAEAQTRLAEFGEGGSAIGRADRTRNALVSAYRALALAPKDVRTLVVVAHLRLLRDEPDSAASAINALRAAAPTAAEVPWLRGELALVRGEPQAILTALDLRASRSRRSARTLFLRAEYDRSRGNAMAACQSLNRLLVLEPSWAPAYVHRALVRTTLGDRRGAWQDAEMATRLGQPAWGNLVSALVDFSVGDSLRTRSRLRQVPALSNTTVLPVLDALLQSALWRATGQTDRALKALALMPCDDPRRRRLRGDPLLGGLSVSPSTCRPSVSPATLTSNPAK